MIKKIKKKRQVKVKENDLTKSENFKKALDLMIKKEPVKDGVLVKLYDKKS